VLWACSLLVPLFFDGGPPIFISSVGALSAMIAFYYARFLASCHGIIIDLN
jgi:hypothetical protein